MADPKLNARLGLDKKEFDAKLKQAEASTTKFGKTMNMVSTSLKGMFTIGGVLAAFGTAKKIFESTQESGDKLAATMKGIAGAATTAAQNIASLDFSVSLRDAYRAAKQLEKVYDDLKDRQRSLNVLSSENTLKVAELQGILRNSTKSEQERKEAAQKIKEIYAEEARLREQSLQNVIEGELDALMTKYHISKQEAQLVLDYATNYAKYTKEQQDALNAAMSAERKLDTYLQNNELTRDKIVNNLKATAETTRNEVIPEMQQWVDLWRPINDLSDKQRDRVAQLLIDYNNILNTRQRELNMADRINDRMDVQIEKARELIQIGGNTAPVISGGKQKTFLERFGINPGQLAETNGAEVNGDPYLDRLNEQLAAQMSLASELEGVFTNLFSTMDQGWKAVGDAVIDTIKRIAAEMLAKAAVWALMNIIFPGSGIAAQTLGSFLGLTQLTGAGSMSGGGMLGSLGSSQGGTIKLQGRIKGTDIALSNFRGGNTLYNGT